MKKQSETQIKIVEFIKTHPSSSPQSIIDGTNMPKITAYSALKSLVNSKAIAMKETDRKKTYNVLVEATSERPLLVTTNTNHTEEKKETKKKPTDGKRDFTKYKFNGEEHSKGGLVRAMVAQYAKDNGLTSIKYYELGNELDLVWSQGNHSVDPSTYASRVVAYQRAIHAVDPTLHIVGGVAATASDNFYNYDKNSVSSYITAAVTAAHNAGTNLDAVSYHWYQNGNQQSAAAYLEWGDWAANTDDANYAGNAYGRAWSGQAAPFIRSQALGSSASTKIGVSELGLDSSNGIHNNGNFVGALWYSDVLGRLAYSGVDWATQYSSFADAADYYAPIYTEQLSTEIGRASCRERV